MENEQAKKFLQGIIDLEKKEVFDENGVKSIIEGFTYAELMSYLKTNSITDANILESFRELVFAHLSAGTAKLSVQGGIGEGNEVAISMKDWEEFAKIIQLIRETSELIYFLDKQ